MLELSDVYVSHGNRSVLSGLNLKISEGEIYGLLGPNGAGKTTALRVITGQLIPQRGTCTVLGAPVNKASKQFIGVVPQEICLFDRLTCEENLRFVAALYGLRGQRRRERIDECLALFELTARRGSLVHTLSGGMQRRLHVALGIVHEPKLLILDEPTVGMDPESRRLLWLLMRRLRSQGLAILLTTHLVDEAEWLCDRIGILRSGRLVVSGSIEELRKSIPAVQIVTIRTQEEEPLLHRLRSLGIPYCVSSSGIDLRLLERTDLPRIILMLEGIEIDAILQRQVSIEDVYFDAIEHDAADRCLTQQQASVQ